MADKYEVIDISSKEDFLSAVQSLDTVATGNIQYRDPISDEYIHAPKRAGVINMRTGELVGVASDAWTPITHADAFSTAINQVETLTGWDNITGRIHDFGNNASMEIFFSDTNLLSAQDRRLAAAEGRIDVGDILQWGIRVANRYKIGTIFKIESFFMRLACKNGMVVSDISASSALNHVSRKWEADIREGITSVIDNLSTAANLIGSRISDAKADTIHMDYMEKYLTEILSFYISERGRKALMKSRWGWDGSQIIDRYTLYNYLTAYATHLQKSQIRYEEIQRAAQYVLATPFDHLIEESGVRIHNALEAAGTAPA